MPPPAKWDGSVWFPTVVGMTTISLTAADGHELAAYVAEPTTAPTAGIVVIQE